LKKLKKRRNVPQSMWEGVKTNIMEGLAELSIYT